LALSEIDTIINQRKLCRELLAHRSLSSAEFCMGYWPEGTGLPGFWETRFAPLSATDHNALTQSDVQREWPSADVAYVVTFESCGNDAGSAFFDAAAVLKHSICENGDDNPDTTYGNAIYAIIHTDAVTCMGPNGVEYDRARLLQSLGYWVKIWGLPVGMEELDAQPYIQANIENDVGLKDLLKLNALKLESEYIVLLDATYHMKEPLDPIFQSLSAPEVKAAYVLDPETDEISTSPLILKGGEDLFDELVTLYKDTPYTAESGWGGSGIGLYPGGMGTRGILSYYFLFNNEDAGDELDRCLFANNGDTQCTNSMFADIYGLTMTDSVCGQPWQCEYPKLSWSTDTKDMCKDFFTYWTQSRYDYQSSHWSKIDTANDGTYYPEVYNGYCNDVGQENYIHMLNNTEATLEVCETMEYVGCEPSDVTNVMTIAGGAELELNAMFPQQCSVYQADAGGAGAQVAFAGTATAREGTVMKDTSIVFVIDRSGSTCDQTNIGCSSYENFDLQEDDILDCEIAAVLDTVAKVRSEGTVAQVGLVSFSSNLGNIIASNVDLELTDIAIPSGDTLHAIEDSIRDVDCGGSTNYAAAVKSACDVIDQSTTEHNLVIYLSDGIALQGGDVGSYCSNHAVFHTIALGETSACTTAYTTDLGSIAADTSGTCTTVRDIPQLREVMKGITDIHVNGIIGAVVPTQHKIDFGCTDIQDWRNIYGLDCEKVETSCQFLGPMADHFGHDGNSACCACGGGESLPVGELTVTKDDGLYREYSQNVRMPPGEHEVCTRFKGTAAGKPGVNEQCSKIYVCPHPDDGVPG